MTDTTHRAKLALISIVAILFLFACGKDSTKVLVNTATTEATTSTSTTSTTIDPEALTDFYAALLVTTTTTVTVPPTAPPTAPPVTAAPVAPAPSGRCAIPDYICARESGFNPNAVNYGGCSGRNCYGKYQFDPVTWDGAVVAMGRPDLIGNYLPDEATQDAVASYLWAGGAGCGHWNSCG